MKRILILLFFAFTASASSQFAMVASWQGASGPVFPVAAYDSLKLELVAQDAIDSVGRAPGDTIGFGISNRAWWYNPYAYYHPTQATGSLKPTVVDSATFTALRFDGVDDVMTSAFPVKHAQPATFMIVLRWYSFGANTQIFGGAEVNDRQTIFQDGFAGTVHLYAGSIFTPPLAYPRDSTILVEATLGPAASNDDTLRLNRLVAFGNAGGFGNAGFVLGNEYDGAGAPGNCAIIAAYYWSKVLDPATRTAMRAYIRDRWGVNIP